MSRFITIIGYIAIALAGIAAEITARIAPNRLAPLEDLLDVLMSSRAARITLLLFWWWLAWHFLAVPPQDA